MQPDQPALCGSRYPSVSRQPNTRIVHCDLPAGHDGDHEETDTESTWPQAQPRLMSNTPATFWAARERAAYERGKAEGIAEERTRASAAIAYRIRAELVCCHIYDEAEGDEAAIRKLEQAGHGICFWGEAGARIAEDYAKTGPSEPAAAARGRQLMDVNDTGAQLRQDLAEEAYKALHASLSGNYAIGPRDLAGAAYAVVERLEGVATMLRRTRDAEQPEPAVEKTIAPFDLSPHPLVRRPAGERQDGDVR